MSFIGFRRIRTQENAVFSERFDIESDLQRMALNNLQTARRKVDHSEILNALSGMLCEIEQDVFRQVEKRLTTYKRLYPDSPIFSTLTLFGPLEYGRLEIAITRSLAWMMNSGEPHGFGCMMAELFWELAGAREGRSVKSVIAIPEFLTAKSQKTGASQRIDIWAQGKWSDESHWTLFIEAKVDAVESADQLLGYEEEIPNEGDWLGVYLTPDGVSPKTGNAEKWKPVSFAQLSDELISCYLNIRKNGKGQTIFGLDFLRLFTAGLIRDVLGRTIPVTQDNNSCFEIADMLGADIMLGGANE
jgi:hypothetical protein